MTGAIPHRHGETVRSYAALRVLESVNIVPCCAAVVFAVLIRAVLTLPSNFWLDETHTYWASGGGMAQLTTRCPVFPLSVLYTAGIVGLRSLGIHSEWALRLPSFLSIVVATIFVFRMALAWWGKTAAWLAAAMFVSLPGMLFTSVETRPYAVGVMCGVISTWLLARFVDRPSFALAVWYALVAALSVYFHLLFGTVMAAHAAYVAYCYWKGMRIPFRPVAVAAICFSLFLLPLVPFALSLTRNPGVHNFAAVPEAADLIIAMVPFAVGVCLLAGLAYAVLFAPEVECDVAAGANKLVLAAAVGFIPLAALFILSRISNSDLFLARYRLCSLAGLALCFGAFSSRIRPMNIVRFMVLGLAVAQLFLIAHASAFRHTVALGDWGAAIRFVDQNTAVDHAPVLVRSQFIESNAMPLSPMTDNPSFSQFTYYPSTSRLTGLAVNFSPAQQRNIDSFLNAVSGSRRFLFMAFDGPSPLGPFVAYISGRLGPNSRARELGNFEGISVVEFTLP